MVVSYEELEHLQACVESVRRHTPGPHTLTVVDNGSGEPIRAYLRSLQDARVLWNESNRGYASACNQGAQAGNGEYVVFLNNDVEVTPGWLDALVRGMGSDPRIAVIGPKLLTPDGHIAFAGAGVMGTNRHHVARGTGLPDGPDVFAQPVDCLGLVGACFMIRRSLVPVLGWFDEGYFFYWEDMDYCLNARLHGYRVVYWPESRVVHHSSVSTAKVGSASATWFQLGRQRFESKWQHVLDDPTEYR
ncbi:glycosyltransferase family 2 protein [Carboxydochorda subterranea]|uniref:Glycosyltransferase family 2 protein n=1 Tax=Carboxydichorda subterranea TaxID=3109565 RepID=A0ABZ1BVG5_9FIRM|nr:glycosyltransferase family 2 protein [Limnochorda sp. L945t]WRP16643.1 glycosyltransferase family 2 protein [Limnochorda sp. L945t]